jgi:hypothetical protein
MQQAVYHIFLKLLALYVTSPCFVVIKNGGLFRAILAASVA